MTTYFVVILILVFISATFSGSEAAFLAISDVHLRTLADKGNKRASRAIKLKQNMHRLIGVHLITQTISDICAAALATAVATKIAGDFGIGLAAGVMSLIVFVAVNLIPKSLAANNPDAWVLFMARPISWVMPVLGPITSFIEKCVSRVVPGIGPHAVNVHVDEDEIRTMAKMGVQAGTVETGEKEMIERVFLFNDITSFDVMTPEEDIVMVDGNSTVAEALSMASSSGLSRFPVFDNDKSNVIGLIHIKDMLRCLEEDSGCNRESAVKRFASDPTFIPKTKPIDDLLREFQKLHNHMALVVNERGSVIGLVTLEDLLEELVGEIADESDIDKHIIQRVDKDTVIVHGDVEIKDINRFLNTKIEAPSRQTLSWVILKELGSIPGEGQQVELADNLVATIEEMNKLKICRVRLDKDLPKE
jgi:CBS domain containing-hemolysin-like protein